MLLDEDYLLIQMCSAQAGQLHTASGFDALQLAAMLERSSASLSTTMAAASGTLFVKAWSISGRHDVDGVHSTANVIIATKYSLDGLANVAQMTTTVQDGLGDPQAAAGAGPSAAGGGAGLSEAGRGQASTSA
jgi:hypothetical protein